MRKTLATLAVGCLAWSGLSGAARADKDDKNPVKEAVHDAAKDLAKDLKSDELKSEEAWSEGSVTVEGKRIDYQAVAGILVVPPKDESGVAEDDDKPDSEKSDKEKHPKAAMSYVAYFKRDGAAGKKDQAKANHEGRPITFIYNGGPGSSTIWLHMGAFGPRRVVTADDAPTPAAPYRLVNNDFSLLDASDLVFIDAPGTGFGKIIGKDKDKAFLGVDADGRAFAEFVTSFLSKYDRWNSPKYLFGESYGTTRSAVLARLLQSKMVDLNGVILLSQILCFDGSVDGANFNPGIDLPYQLALPTYAATAWYHHKIADAPKDLAAFLAEVEHFAMTDYGVALAAGNALDPAQRRAIIEKLHRYTGLSAAYLEKADLRITGGMFEKNLLGDDDITVGRLDTRFSGPTIDPLSKEADYDPQSAAIGSAYVAALNDYVRRDLKFGADRTFKVFADVGRKWDFLNQPDGAPFALPQATNVLLDLAAAMKTNPNLKVQLNAGYYDLATPFYEGVFEMQHLPIPPKLQGNVEFRFYESGHMVYAHEASLKALHDNVADFIRRTDNVH